MDAQHYPRIQTAEQLEAALLAANQPETVRVASGSLRQFLKGPECVVAMVQQVSASANPVARQMAAVLVRKKIGIFWRRLNPQAQEMVRTALLERLAMEPVRPVVNAVASLVSAVARQAVPRGEWNELLNFLFTMSQSEKPHHREVAMVLFTSLAETIGEHLHPHFANLQAIFHRGLCDRGSDAVRLRSLRALGTLVDMVRSDEEVVAFSQCVPDIVAFARELLEHTAKSGVMEADVEEAVAVAFETFDTLAGAEKPVLQPHVVQLVQFILPVLVNRALPVAARSFAGNFLCRLVEERPATVANRGLGPDMVRASIMLMMEPHDESDAADGQTPQKVGVLLLDTALEHLPRKELYALAVRTAAQELAPSPEPLKRKAALVTLAVVPESCHEMLEGGDLEPLLQIVLRGLSDRELVVRHHAHVAVTQFCEWLKPTVLKYLEHILPPVLAALDNPQEHTAVKRQCCSTLDAITEDTPAEVLQPYTEALMARLLPLAAHSDYAPVRATAMEAVASCARASGVAFVPFAEPVMRVVLAAMRLEGDEALEFRCLATECAGAVAAAVEFDAFSPFLQESLDLALAGTRLDYIELRTSAYTYFGHLAAMLGEQFAQLLPVVMPLLLASLQSNDGLVARSADPLAAGAAAVPGGDVDGDSDEDEAEEARGRLHVSIRTASLEEKIAALSALQLAIEHAPLAMVDVIADVTTAVSQMSTYPMHKVRLHVMAVLRDTCTLLARAFAPEEPRWRRGVAAPLPEQVDEFVAQLVGLMVQRAGEDPDLEVVAASLEGLTAALEGFGYGALGGGAFAPLAEVLLAVWKEEAPCQKGVDAERIERDEEREHDDVLAEAASDLVIMMAATGGPLGGELFMQLAQPVALFCGERRPVKDRSMGLGTLSEMVDGCGAAGAQLAAAALPVALAGLATPNAAVCRNAAFCVGVCFRHAPAANAPRVEEALRALAAVLQAAVPEERRDDAEFCNELQGARDNAASAVAKILTALPQAVPVEQCVALVVSGCPLTGDYSETEFVYPCLARLYEQAPAALAPHAVALARCVALGLGDPEVPEPAKAALMSLGRVLGRDHAQAFQGASPDARRALGL